MTVSKASPGRGGALAAVFLLGFSSGLPFALTAGPMQAWMTRGGIDVAVIGAMAAVTLPYSLKFLWSPLMDRFVPPLLGRRRGWMILCQFAAAGAIAAMAAVGVGNLWALAVTASLVAFFSASQDIVIDAYRTEILAPHELGLGAGLATSGYRIGLLCSASLSMVAAAHIPWPVVYMLMAAGMLVGVVTTLSAPEPAVGVRPPATLREAVVRPLVEFLRRRGAGEILAFILIYKCDAAMVAGMMTRFMLDLGFLEDQIGLVSQGLGLGATIVGATLGGAVITRLGIRRALWSFGLLQAMAGISFTALALAGRNVGMMVAAILVENLCAGMATAAFIGFIMSLCDKRFTATQFALLTSLMALGRTGAQVPSGWLARQIGWPGFFLVATVIAAPSLLLLTRYRTWEGALQDSPRPLETPTRSQE